MAICLTIVLGQTGELREVTEKEYKTGNRDGWDE